MSSDDDVMQITEVVPSKKRKHRSTFPRVVEQLAKEQLEHILVEVVETEVCVMADSEIFYNLEDPGDDHEAKLAELAALELYTEL